MLQMSSTCYSVIIRSSSSAILLKLQQRAVEEADESESESQERTMRVLKLTEGRGFNESGIIVFRTLTGTSSEQRQSDKK